MAGMATRARKLLPAFDELVPDTPLKERVVGEGETAAESAIMDQLMDQRPDCKLTLQIVNYVEKKFPAPNGLRVEQYRGNFEAPRLVISQALKTVHPEAALVACRPGDPKNCGTAEAPFTFHRKYNILLYQILSAVCVFGHAAGLVAEYAEEEDGRACLLSLLGYAEPHLDANLGMPYYLQVFASTEIKGGENPLDAFLKMNEARSGLGRLTGTAMDEAMFFGFLLRMVGKNDRYETITQAIEHGTINATSAKLQRMVTGAWTRKENRGGKSFDHSWHGGFGDFAWCFSGS